MESREGVLLSDCVYSVRGEQHDPIYGPYVLVFNLPA
jgi:hypothetical protein